MLLLCSLKLFFAWLYWIEEDISCKQRAFGFNHIFYSDIPVSDFGPPFKTFRLSRKFSGQSSQSCLTIYILTDRNFRNFWVNVKHSLTFFHVCIVFYRDWLVKIIQSE